ncbi:MAG: polyprenyl synthetase family protein [Candidatus Dormibacteraceae bacterium]
MAEGSDHLGPAPLDLFGPVADDLARLESSLLSSIAGDGDPMARPMTELFRAGGKRVRPALVFLFASLGGAGHDRLEPAAMAVELTHAATLIHDDVIDRSPVRRGRPTVVSTLGHPRAIVVADFYFAKAYREAGRSGAEVVTLLAEAVMSVCAGELIQQAARFHYRTPIEHYLRRIELKTASLVAASCEIGAVVGGLAPEAVRAAARYGRDLGLAFQVADDVLDYAGAPVEIGKPVGHDLTQGSATLPLLLALQDPVLRPRLATALPEGRELTAEEAAAVVEMVRSTPATHLARDRARSLAAAARGSLAEVPAGPVRDCLANLTTYVVERKL